MVTIWPYFDSLEFKLDKKSGLNYCHGYRCNKAVWSEQRVPVKLLTFESTISLPLSLCPSQEKWKYYVPHILEARGKEHLEKVSPQQDIYLKSIKVNYVQVDPPDSGVQFLVTWFTFLCDDIFWKFWNVLQYNIWRKLQPPSTTTTSTTATTTSTTTTTTFNLLRESVLDMY